MKRQALVASLLVVLALAGLLPAPVCADEPFFDPVHFKLDNGLEMWVQPRPETPAVALRLMVRVGSRYETADNNGISHFVEHMVFTGSEKWDEAEIRPSFGVGGILALVIALLLYRRWRRRRAQTQMPLSPR